MHVSRSRVFKEKKKILCNVIKNIEVSKTVEDIVGCGSVKAVMMREVWSVSLNLNSVLILSLHQIRSVKT